MDKIILPSAHQMDDQVWVNFWGSSLIGEVVGIHFYHGKVKYDLQVSAIGDDTGTTRIYNIDSAFVTKIHPDHKD